MGVLWLPFTFTKKVISKCAIEIILYFGIQKFEKIILKIDHILKSLI